MKKRNYLWKLCIVVLMFAVGILFGAESHNVQATEKTVMTSPGTSCKDGNYIYYAYEMSGIRMGIMRLNPKTGAKKEIYSYKYKGNATNGFYDLTVKGNYIYAVWNQGYGSSVYNPYIYKIRKDGKGSKQLAVGNCPVIADGYIYYVEYQKTKNEYWSKTGYICRMKLDGSGKKRIKYVGNQLNRLFTDGKTVRYSTSYYVNDDSYNIIQDMNGYNDSGVTTVDGCQYSFYKSGYKKTSIYRTNLKTGKKTRIAYFPSGIQSYRVVGDYLMIKTYIQDGKYLSIYCISSDGKVKNRLTYWRPAE